MQSFFFRNKTFLFLLFILGVFIPLLLFILSLFSSNKTAVEVSSSPTGATVMIDGRKIEQKTPFTLPGITIGDVLVMTFSHEGYITKTKSIRIIDRPVQKMLVVLEKSNIPFEGASEGLRIEQNPKYIQEVREQPFWEKLPYYTSTFKIEYIDSYKKIVITTFPPERNTNIYRQGALRWLRENGAKLETLTIEYQQGVKTYTL